VGITSPRTRNSFRPCGITVRRSAPWVCRRTSRRFAAKVRSYLSPTTSPPVCRWRYGEW